MLMKDELYGQSVFFGLLPRELDGSPETVPAPSNGNWLPCSLLTRPRGMGIASAGREAAELDLGCDCSVLQLNIWQGGSHLDHRPQVQAQTWQFSFLQEAPGLFTQKCYFAQNLPNILSGRLGEA